MGGLGVGFYNFGIVLANLVLAGILRAEEFARQSLLHFGGGEESPGSTGQGAR